MAKGDVKNWRKSVDGQFKWLKDWTKDMDKWKKGVDDWRYGVDNWGATVSVDIACMKENIFTIQDDILSMKKSIYVTQEDIKDIRANMYTKQEHYEYMAKIDAMLGEVQESRRERQIQGYGYSTMDDQLDPV